MSELVKAVCGELVVAYTNGYDSNDEDLTPAAERIIALVEADVAKRLLSPEALTAADRVAGPFGGPAEHDGWQAVRNALAAIGIEVPSE